jgi:hypothetical protein
MLGASEGLQVNAMRGVLQAGLNVIACVFGLMAALSGFIAIEHLVVPSSGMFTPGTAISAAIYGVIAWALFRWAARVGQATGSSGAEAFGLAGLRELYVEQKLAGQKLTLGANNRYSALPDGEVIDVYRGINPDVAPDAWDELLAVIATRVERAFTPDGRRLPESVVSASRVAAPAHALCAKHPESPASITCARCGAFACAPCTGVSGAHCAPCVDLLMAGG